MRLAVLGTLAAWAAGAALLADAILHGRASLSLVVILPVFSGRSPEFLLGVVLLVLGFFLLPLALWEPSDSEPLSLSAEGPAGAPPTGHAVGGGVVLIGPVPIFFGAWKNVSRRVRFLAALAGAVLLVLLVVGFLVTVR
jgi:uncharacterized protein (TIGR00304 family)